MESKQSGNANECVICYEALNFDDPYDVATCKNNHAIHVACYEKIQDIPKMCVVRCGSGYTMKNPRDAVVEYFLLDPAKRPLNLHIKLLLSMIESDTPEEDIIACIERIQCTSTEVFAKLLRQNKQKACAKMIEIGYIIDNTYGDVEFFIEHARIVNMNGDLFEILIRFKDKVVNYEKLKKDILEQLPHVTPNIIDMFVSQFKPNEQELADTFARIVKENKSELIQHIMDNRNTLGLSLASCKNLIANAVSGGNWSFALKLIQSKEYDIEKNENIQDLQLLLEKNMGNHNFGLMRDHRMQTYMQQQRLHDQIID